MKMSDDWFTPIKGKYYEFSDGEQKGLGFTLVERLGTGVAGEVWKVSVSDGTTGALKVYSKKLDKNEHARIQFEVEANIKPEGEWFIQASGSGTVRNRSAILFPFVESSKDLHSFIKDDDPDVDTRLEVSTDLTNSVIKLHNQGILHNDIKSRNVLFCDGDATPTRLIDFQFSCQNDDDEKIQRFGKATKPVGTRGYMAPEVASAPKFISESSDIWSLGCTLYHIFTGREIADILLWTNEKEEFTKKCKEAYSEPIISPEEMAKDGVPSELCQTLSKMLTPLMSVRTSDLLMEMAAECHKMTYGEVPSTGGSAIVPDGLKILPVELQDNITVVIHPSGKPAQYLKLRKDERKHIISHHFDGLRFPNRKLLSMVWDGEGLICSGREYVRMIGGERLRSTRLGSDETILFDGLPTRIICQSTNP